MMRLRGATVTIAAAVVVATPFYVWWKGAPFARPASHSAGTLAEMKPIPLPDVSRLDARLQQEVRQYHAALTNTFESGAASSRRAEVAGSYGKLLLATEYMAEAESAFIQAQALDPSDLRWPYYLGHVYRAQQEPARAIPAFERVLSLEPDHVPSLIWLGDLHLARGDTAGADSYLQRASALQPDSAAAISRLGRTALARRDYAHAIEYLERALLLKPDALSVHYPLGMAYRGVGQAAKAEANLQRASEGGGIAPSDPLMDVVAALLQNAGAYEARGMEALAARDWNTAVENLRKAAEIAPLNAVTHSNLGTALSLSGDSAGARRELVEAVRLDPGLAKAHFALGLLAQDEGLWNEAIDRFSAAIRHDADFVDAHFTLAEALRRAGRVEQSLPHYLDVLRLNRAASQARFGYAMALVRLRRYEEARRSLTDAVRLHPDQPGLPHALARILAAAPDPEVRDGDRALVLIQPLLKPRRSAAVSETMAMALAELGRFDEAAKWQQRAIATAREDGQPALATRMRDNLELYRQRQPCRTPWRDDDPVIAVAPKG
jgi:tetratricopeptide (TPR) repeat protein